MFMPAADAKTVIASRIAHEFDNEENIIFVNTGVGLPTLVVDRITNPNVIIQTENGILGVGPFANEQQVDFNLINAGRQHVTMAEGCSFMDSASSFAMIRGGHIDVAILGAFEVDQYGNVSNWIIPGGKKLGVGGAMDLVSGAKRVIIAMQHTDSDGNSKVKKQCKLPITAYGEVDMLVTEHCVFEFLEGKMFLREVARGMTPEDIRKITEAEFEIDEPVAAMEI